MTGRALRCIGYLRVSTERQAGEQFTSLADQEKAIAGLATTLERPVERWFRDAGASGATVAGRAAFRELLQFCERQPCPPATPGLVIILNDSRFGRFEDPDEAAALRFRLKQWGWHVRFVEGDGIEDVTLRSVVRALGSAQASEYRANLSRNSKRGMRGAAELGFWTRGRTPFGYRRQVVYPPGRSRTLSAGERKANDEKVCLVPGPEAEVTFVQWPHELLDRLAEGAARREGDPFEAFCARRPHGGDQRERGHRAHHEVDGPVAGHQARDAEAAPDAELGHGGQEPARLAHLLGGHHVGDDAGVRRAGGVEEELDDRVAHDDLRVAARGHQKDQARKREQRSGDHDRSPPAESRVQPVRPRPDEGRHGHRQDAAEAERHADRGVLRTLGHHLVDLSLDQHGGQRYPQEVAAEPEGAQRRVLKVAEARLQSLADHIGRRHGARLQLIGFPADLKSARLCRPPCQVSCRAPKRF